MISPRWGRYCGVYLLFAILVFGGALSPVRASVPLDMDLSRLQFDWFEESESFASIAVIDILQDRRGFIWVGTRDGIYRYDGRRFMRYRSGENERRELPHNQVNKLYEDSQGRLWAGLQRGAVYYDPELDRFIPCDIGLYQGPVRDFAETETGELLLLGEGIGIARLEGDSTFRGLGLDIQEGAYCLEPDEKIGFLVGGRSGIQIIDKDFVLGETYGAGESFLEARQAEVRTINRVSPTTFWVGTNRSGSWLFEVENGTFQKVQESFKQEDLVGSVLIDRQGDVLVGSTAGLVVYSPEGVRKEVYRNKGYSLSSIQPGTVYALSTDRQGNLWVGSSRGGLSVVRNSKAFAAIDINAKVPLSKRKVTSVMRDSQERLWVGYHNEGLDILNQKDSSKLYLDPHEDSIGSLGRGSVWDIVETSDGKIWVGTNRDGLCVMEPGGSEFHVYLRDRELKSSLQGSDVRVIVLDEKENLWLGVHGYGIDYLDRETGEFINYENPLGEWIEDLVFDASGSLWVGCTNGLSVYNDIDGVPVDFEHDPNDEYSISDNHVVCLFIDSSETLWVGTGNGLCRYEKETSRFIRYGLDNGLPGTSICSIIESTEGDIWVATTEGLARLDSDSQTFKAFHKYDGLLSDEFVQRSSYVSKDGEFYVGCEKGLVTFRPEEIESSSDAPDVLVTGISIQNVVQDSYGEEDSEIAQTLFTADEVVLGPGTSAFGFEFAALDYLSAGRNNFEYQLEGFDQDWIKNDQRAECYYTNMPPGEYTFRVRASNSDGVWNEAGASLAVILQPFFWQTLWFQISVVATIILTIVAGVRIRLAGLARQKAVLVETVSDRTKELRGALSELEQQKARIEDQNLELIDHRENLEELILQRTSELQIAKEKAEESDRLKSAFLENISHEIRTPMNAIIGFVNVLRGGDCEQDEQEEYLQIIEENGEYLTAMIDDIIELSLLESQKVTLSPQRVHVREFFERWNNHLKTELKKKEKTGIVTSFQTRTDIDPELEISIDRGRLDQIVGQLVENAIKFTDHGKISLSYELCHGDSDTLLIGVEDTGVGIPKEKLDSIFNLFRKILGEKKRLYRGTGLGLAIVKRIVDLMEGEIFVETEMGKGTRFIVRIPLEATIAGTAVERMTEEK